MTTPDHHLSPFDRDCDWSVDENEDIADAALLHVLPLELRSRANNHPVRSEAALAELIVDKFLNDPSNPLGLAVHAAGDDEAARSRAMRLARHAATCILRQSAADLIAVLVADIHRVINELGNSVARTDDRMRRWAAENQQRLQGAAILSGTSYDDMQQRALQYASEYAFEVASSRCMAPASDLRH